MPGWEALGRKPQPLNSKVEKTNAQFPWELILPTLGGMSRRNNIPHSIKYTLCRRKIIGRA